MRAMWPWILGTLAACNLIAFLAHGVDKWRAGHSSRRTPEKTLLLLAVPLASPGAWLGMRTFRHKTSKSSFKWKMIAVTVLNALTVGGLLYAAGRYDWF
jgi:uncharacterized membrane protein YsdA (DUF1294 family)